MLIDLDPLPIVIYAGLTGLGVVWAYFYIPETNGRSEFSPLPCRIGFDSRRLPSFSPPSSRRRDRHTFRARHPCKEMEGNQHRSHDGESGRVKIRESGFVCMDRSVALIVESHVQVGGKPSSKDTWIHMFRAKDVHQPTAAQTLRMFSGLILCVPINRSVLEPSNTASRPGS